MTQKDKDTLRWLLKGLFIGVWFHLLTHILGWIVYTGKQLEDEWKDYKS